MDSIRKEKPSAKHGIVLVAEDEPIVRSVISTNLRRMGLHVLTISDGIKAVEMCRNHPVDLALLEVL